MIRKATMGRTVSLLALLVCVHHAVGGEIRVWGDSGFGETTPPVGNDFVDVAMGSNFGVALREDGSLVGWGRNDQGQCDVPAGNDFISVKTGWHHAMAVRANGSVEAWGDLSYIGDVPTGVYNRVSGGCAHSAAIKADGTLVVWGAHGEGQWDWPDGSGFFAIEAGTFHNIALQSDNVNPYGPVHYWGPSEGSDIQGYENGTWSLVYHEWDPSEPDNWTKVEQSILCDEVPTGSFEKIASGYYHNLALRGDGTIVAWGWDHNAVLDVPAGFDWEMIAVGYHHSVAYLLDGTIEVWGGWPYGDVAIASGEQIDVLDAGSYTIAAIVVPEPATLSLLAFGGMALLRRRRTA